MMLFHFFTQSLDDTMSSFAGQGKTTDFKTWKVCPAVTQAFINLPIFEVDTHEIELLVLLRYN